MSAREGNITIQFVKHYTPLISWLSLCFSFLRQTLNRVLYVKNIIFSEIVGCDKCVYNVWFGKKNSRTTKMLKMT